MQSTEALPRKYLRDIDYGVDIESPDEESSLGEQNKDPEEAFNRHWGYLPPLDEEDLPTYYQGDINYGVNIDGLDEEYSLEQHNLDPQEAFNRKWGYLPPLDEEAAVIIDGLIINPANAMAFARINPASNGFLHGLDARNVNREENKTPDPYAAELDLQPHSLRETAAEKESYERLWTLDRAACVDGSNEALFQRTLTMGFIARHCLVGRTLQDPLILILVWKKAGIVRRCQRMTTK